MAVPVIPEYLHRKLTEQYGSENTGRIEAGFSQIRPVTLRVNTLKTTRKAVTDQLDRHGIRWQGVEWYDDAIILPDVREDALRSLPVYEAGEIYLQSLSAMVPALVLSPLPDEAVLDMAAAPGGKTTQMAALSGGRCTITACEKNKTRAERLRFNLERQGAGRVTVMNQDARELSDFFSFDRILLDAPCTGSGTILLTEGEPQRRMDEAWVKKTANTQLSMLKKALRLLKKGHEMVYSTCSILNIENEQVVRRAIEEAGARVLPVDAALTDALPKLPVSIPGTITIPPTALYEGFFIARIVKG